MNSAAITDKGQDNIMTKDCYDGYTVEERHTCQCEQVQCTKSLNLARATVWTAHSSYH